ncbi:MAG: DUF4288 domain-containing protein [Chitinophagaceae bacterium]|nr:DUF4288 domain-containing protein [Chitinophagaceae bacterium]
MNWYMAKIVFRIICGEGQHTPQFDEQLRLIGAQNEAEAFEKAKAIGENDQETFLNQKNQVVHWKFINVPELYKLSLTDGAEMYSRVQETEHAGNFIDAINKKADHILAAFSKKISPAF